MRATSAAIPRFEPKLPIASGGFEAVISISQAPGFGRLLPDNGRLHLDPKLPVVNGRYRAAHSATGRLTRGLLAVVGAEAIYRKDIRKFCRLCHSTGRPNVL